MSQARIGGKRILDENREFLGSSSVMSHLPSCCLSQPKSGARRLEKPGEARGAAGGYIHFVGSDILMPWQSDSSTSMTIS
jgi:hypothetical protein